MKKRHVISHLKKHPAAKTPDGKALLDALMNYDKEQDDNDPAAEETPNTDFERDPKSKMFKDAVSFMKNPKEEEGE